jgi:hypothetical protein
MALDYITRKNLAEKLAAQSQQSIPGGGLAGVLAQALSGGAAGYLQAKNSTYEGDQRKALMDALKSGDQQSAINIASSSEIPQYNEFGLSALAQQMKPQDPIKVDAGGALIDPRTGKEIYSRPNEISPYQQESLDLRRQQMQDNAALRREMIDVSRMNSNNRQETRAPSGYQFKNDGTLSPIPGGPDDPKTKIPEAGKALPVSVLKELSVNQGTLNKINDALNLSSKNPNAFGLDNYIPGIDRIAPAESIAARAAIADIGSALIHDRSGAAVTLSEFPRLRPFIPQTTDTPTQVNKKLLGLKKAIEQETNGYLTTYEAQGYNVRGNSGAAAIPPPAANEIAEYLQMKKAQQ